MKKEIVVPEKVSKRHDPVAVEKAIAEIHKLNAKEGTTTVGIKFKLAKNIIFLL